METLFFTIVVLFFLGIAVYYFFQRNRQGSLLPKKKEKPEIISPEPQLYTGSDSAPTLEQALEEIQDEPPSQERLPDNETVQRPLVDEQGLTDNYREKPDVNLNENIDKGLDQKQETEQRF